MGSSACKISQETTRTQATVCARSPIARRERRCRWQGGQSCKASAVPATRKNYRKAISTGRTVNYLRNPCRPPSRNQSHTRKCSRALSNTCAAPDEDWGNRKAEFLFARSLNTPTWAQPTRDHTQVNWGITPARRCRRNLFQWPAPGAARMNSAAAPEVGNRLGEDVAFFAVLAEIESLDFVLLADP